MKERRVVILTGPTASGKSACAASIAREIPAVITNADSKQVYKEIPIISAQPTAAEKQELPHAAYGFLSASEACSAGTWLDHVIPIIERCWSENRLPLLVGGTGLYLQALMHGMSPIPTVSTESESATRIFLETKGLAALRAEIERIDPLIAARLEKNDTQRLMRAYAVWLSTGIPLSTWHKTPATPALQNATFSVFALIPPREKLYQNAETRFHHMCKHGALEEVAALAKQNLPTHLPAMKAHGVPELIRYMNQEISLDEAASIAILNTRHYIKRQCTWFRNQLPEATVAESGEEMERKILKLVTPKA